MAVLEELRKKAQESTDAMVWIMWQGIPWHYCKNDWLDVHPGTRRTLGTCEEENGLWVCQRCRAELAEHLYFMMRVWYEDRGDGLV